MQPYIYHSHTTYEYNYCTKIYYQKERHYTPLKKKKSFQKKWYERKKILNLTIKCNAHNNNQSIVNKMHNLCSSYSIYQTTCKFMSYYSYYSEAVQDFNAMHGCRPISQWYKYLTGLTASWYKHFCDSNVINSSVNNLLYRVWVWSIHGLFAFLLPYTMNISDALF